MSTADLLDARVLASLRAGNATAKAISESEGVNSTAVKNALERLEARDMVIKRGAMWKALPARGQA